MLSARSAFLSHKAKDFRLAERCRNAIQELLSINVFMSEDIPKHMVSAKKYTQRLKKQTVLYCSSRIQVKIGRGACTRLVCIILP